jgi:hypothetical protein
MGELPKLVGIESLWPQAAADVTACPGAVGVSGSTDY